jgi:hypothetical protein
LAGVTDSSGGPKSRSVLDFPSVPAEAAGDDLEAAALEIEKGGVLAVSA